MVYSYHRRYKHMDDEIKLMINTILEEMGRTEERINKSTVAGFQSLVKLPLFLCPSPLPLLRPSFVFFSLLLSSIFAKPFIPTYCIRQSADNAIIAMKWNAGYFCHLLSTLRNRRILYLLK